MTKRDLTIFLDTFFTRNGLQKIKNDWLIESVDLIKIIKLQKSSFGNQYYLNYGYILKKIDLGKLEFHIFNRLGSPIKEENHEIAAVLDLENNLDKTFREKKLELYIEKYILREFSDINKIEDLVSLLKRRPNLNDVPLIVKKYLAIDNDAK
jgi:hypothetical protein